MGSDRHSERSDLFLVRVWVSHAGGDTTLRGKVQHAVNGEEHYFRDLPELPELLRAMMPGRTRRADLRVPESRADGDPGWGNI